MPDRRGPSSWRVRAGFGLLLLVMGFGNLVAARADTESPPVTVMATVIGKAQTNVAPNGPLTGLVDGDIVTLKGTGNPAPFFGFDVRVCKAGVDVVQQSDFAPTQGGNCIATAFSGGAADLPFKQVSAAPANTEATWDFVIGTGTQTFTWGGTETSTITCGVGNPCAMWLKLQVLSTFNAGNAWVHYDLVYGADVATTTTTTTSTSTTLATGTTTTVAGTTTTRASTTTSTTSPAGTTTTIAGSTTSTTTGPLTVSPTSVAPGGTLNVTTTGWKADSTITATMTSDPVTLGTLTADGTGKAAKAFTVPAGVSKGAHTLKMAGTGIDGAARELTATVTVTDPVASTTPTTTTGTLARAGSDVSHPLVSALGLLLAGCLLLITALRGDRRAASRES